MDIWNNSPHHEVKTLALFFFSSLGNDFLLKKWNRIKTISLKIENWAHADSYCSIVARLFEAYPQKIRPQLQKWNRSHNFWERRISVVGLYYYSSLRSRQPDTKLATNLLQSLLDDEEYYVQKAIGWTLRELGNTKEKELKLFLKRNIAKIHPVAFTTAIEKISQTDKEKLKRNEKKALLPQESGQNKKITLKRHNFQNTSSSR